MINKIIWVVVSIFFVFVQLFLFDNFNFKFGLIFIPIFYLHFRREDTFRFFYSSAALISVDLFVGNSFFGLACLSYFLVVDLLSYLKNNLNVEMAGFLEVIYFIFIYYYIQADIFSLSFLITLMIFLGLYLIRFIRRNGYLRFN